MDEVFGTHKFLLGTGDGVLEGGLPSGRPAVKKSHARIASAWERRNCDQVGPVRRRRG